MGTVTILKSNCKKINEKSFIKWLNIKKKSWWNNYGLSMTGEHSDQDDEADVRSFIPEIIEEFNDTQTLHNKNDIGCLNALCDMVEEYLKEKHKAKKEEYAEVYSDTNITIIRK